MEPLEKAKSLLPGNSCALVREESCIVSRERGIFPILNLIKEGFSLQGFSIADKVIGRAVAFLFIKAKVKEVYGETMSVGADELLNKHGIPHSYGTLAEKIINRSGDGLCPMEESVEGIDDVDEAYIAINRKVKSLQKSK